MHGIDIECFQNVVKDRNEVQKDNTLIRRLPLSLDFHREGKGGVGVSDAQYILGGRGQEGWVNSGEAKHAIDKQEILKSVFVHRKNHHKVMLNIHYF